MMLSYSVTMSLVYHLLDENPGPTRYRPVGKSP
jgi:hypothetical protein